MHTMHKQAYIQFTFFGGTAFPLLHFMDVQKFPMPFHHIMIITFEMPLIRMSFISHHRHRHRPNFKNEKRAVHIHTV